MLKLEPLPKGFRFRPTDEELVNHYLRLKINGHNSLVQVIPEVDVCKREPWDLPALSVIKSDDPEWFFFCPRDRKYPNGHRSNRATEAGYWKATGKDRTIKSRKSSPSGRFNIQLIGMKKTLVFYKGRAPKGERTNWIMHEYRATEPDLDGSGPGQGDYVLCRLFHKVHEKLNNSKSEDVEASGSSPYTGKSSPDDVTSDLFEEPAVVGVVMKELEDVNEQWQDKVDPVISMSEPVAVRCESYGSDHPGGETAREAYNSSPSIENPKSGDATNNQSDNEVLNTLQTSSYSDLGACMGSPFAYDFGYDPNGLHFQDGTTEQDASISDLLASLQNLDNYMNSDLTAHKNFSVTSESSMPESSMSQVIMPIAICDANHYKIHGESHAQMVGSQYPGELGETSSVFPQLLVDHALPQHGAGGYSCADNLMNSHQKHDDLTFIPNSIEGGITPVSGTRIKTQSRQPRNVPSSVNHATQGNASRRIHLGVILGSNSIEQEKSENHNNTEEQESHLLISEATKTIDRTCKSHNPEGGYLEKANEIGESCNWSPGKPADAKGGKMGLMPSLVVSVHKGASHLNVYALSIYIVVIISVVFLGMWRCPSLTAPYG